ncbi:MAG: hypothetical protein KC468_02570, partial [Myxococcales bacterium]|nr:hypothetical protein [Myxococcales bacterium]
SVDVASVDASVDVASVDVASEDIASEDIASDEDHDAAPTTEHAVDAPISSPGLFPPIDADAPPRARADATPPELFADVTSAPEPRRGATPIVLGLVALLVIGFGLWFALTRGGDERDPTIAAIERHEGAREADGAAESADAAERPGSSSSDDPDDAAEPLKPAASDVDAPDEVEPDEVEPDEVEPDEVEPDEVEPDEVEPDEVEPDDDTPDEPTATSTKSTSEKPKPARKKTLAATWKYLEKRVRTQCTKLVSGPTKVSVELTLRGPEGRVKAVALGSHAMTSLGKCVASSISRSNVKPFDPGPEPVIKRDLAFD